MTRGALQLGSLRVFGAEKTDATLDFVPGLNVVHGASDTGKSHILQLLNFMLGSQDVPSPIPQSAGYTTSVLGLLRPDGLQVELQRSMKGGAFEAREFAADASLTRTLGLEPKHRAGSENTISRYLLESIGAADARVRKNKSGQTTSATISLFRPLSVVDEARIIKKQSPILSGQYTKKTEELSLFQYVMSGEDDSSLIAVPSAPQHKAGKEARLGMLDTLIASATSELESLEATPQDLGLPESATVDTVEQIMASETEDVVSVQRRLDDLEVQRREIWQTLTPLRNRLAIVRALEKRYALLSEQYASDSNRLTAVLEADGVLESWSGDLGNCPVCNRPWDVADHEHEADGPSWREAIQAESDKLRGLQSDLSQVREELARESTQLESNVASTAYDHRAVVSKLEQSLEPELRRLQTRLAQLAEARSTLEKKVLLEARLDELRALREATAQEKRPQEPQSAIQRQSLTAHTRELCRIVGNLLKEWEFPYSDDVVFAEDSLDLVLSGRERSSLGKGLRAISHAAFSVGLMLYCIERSLPHLGFVVLDSPLLAYKDPDPDDEEDIPEALGDLFYRSLARVPPRCQITILENVAPPMDVEAAASVTRFSGTSGMGRAGFYPLL